MGNRCWREPAWACTGRQRPRRGRAHIPSGILLWTQHNPRTASRKMSRGAKTSGTGRAGPRKPSEHGGGVTSHRHPGLGVRLRQASPSSTGHSDPLPGDEKRWSQSWRNTEPPPSTGAPVPACPFFPGASPPRSRTPPQRNERSAQATTCGTPGAAWPRAPKTRARPACRAGRGLPCDRGRAPPPSDAQVLSWWLHPTRMDSEPGVMTRRRGARQEAVWVLRTSLRPYAVPH